MINIVFCVISIYCVFLLDKVKIIKFVDNIITGNYNMV